MEVYPRVNLNWGPLIVLGLTASVFFSHTNMKPSEFVLEYVIVVYTAKPGVITKWNNTI